MAWSPPRQRRRQPARRPPVFRPWQPFRPQLTPPPGMYDPTLDANLGAADRGLGDTVQDVETQRGRLTSDYLLGVQGIDQGASRSLEDIERQRAYGTADHERSLADLRLAYQRRANQQLQMQNRMGVLAGGAAIQAAEKRAANQAHDQAPIDEGFRRLVAGLDTAKQRTIEDQQRERGILALQQAPPDEGNPLGGRAFQDLVTQLTRAQREGVAFHLDTGAAKAAQASAAGWNPYAGRPANQTGSGARARKTVVRGGYAYVIDPSGRIISKRRVR